MQALEYQASGCLRDCALSPKTGTAQLFRWRERIHLRREQHQLRMLRWSRQRSEKKWTQLVGRLWKRNQRFRTAVCQSVALVTGPTRRLRVNADAISTILQYLIGCGRKDHQIHAVALGQ